MTDDESRIMRLIADEKFTVCVCVKGKWKALVDSSGPLVLSWDQVVEHIRANGILNVRVSRNVAVLFTGDKLRRFVASSWRAWPPEENGPYPTTLAEFL